MSADVRMVSPLPAREVRNRLGEHVKSTARLEEMELLQHDRMVVGWIADPTFEFAMVGPSTQGKIGPIGWRAPYRSRRLKGTLVEAPGGQSVLEGTFRPQARLWTMPGNRREEAHLLEWLAGLLEEGR